MIYAIKKIIKKMGQSISPKDVIAIDRIVSADHEFEGKNVFISGGSGGIGLAIARLLLESGANVVLGGTNQEKLDSCVRDLGYDGRVSSVVIDLLDIAGVESAVAAVTSCYGGVDILIVSSGVHTENVDLWSMTPEEYDRVMAVNLKGSFFLAREVAKQMIALNKKGHILFVGSSRGFEPAWSLRRWASRLVLKMSLRLIGSFLLIMNLKERTFSFREGAEESGLRLQGYCLSRAPTLFSVEQIKKSWIRVSGTSGMTDESPRW